MPFFMEVLAFNQGKKKWASAVICGTAEGVVAGRMGTRREDIPG